MRPQVALLAIVAAAAAARADPAAVDPAGRLPIGLRLSIAGGVSNFVGASMREMADLGGAWDVRLTTHSRSWWSEEFAYAGSVRGFLAPNVPDRGSRTMLTHALEVSGRLNKPWMTPRWMLEPFLSLGIGWTHVQLENVPAQDLVRASDDLFVVPMAAGVSFVHDSLLVEGRFTYRQTFGENLVTTSSGGTASLASWSTTLALGYEF